MSGTTLSSKKPKSPATKPKPKPKSKPAPPKKIHRSEERVVESSDEGEEVGSTSVYETTTGKSETEAESESGSEEDESLTEEGSGSDEESQPLTKDSFVPLPIASIDNSNINPETSGNINTPIHHPRHSSPSPHLPPHLTPSLLATLRVKRYGSSQPHSQLHSQSSLTSIPPISRRGCRFLRRGVNAIVYGLRKTLRSLQGWHWPCKMGNPGVTRLVCSSCH